MLSDDELNTIWTDAFRAEEAPSGSGFQQMMDATRAGGVAALRAVEAVVRADQAQSYLTWIKAKNAYAAELAEQLAAAQAVIARARAANDSPHENTKQSNSRMTAVSSALAQSPPEALQAYDRKVAAKTKAAIIQRLRDTAQTGRTDSMQHAVADWLELEALDSEPSTPKLCWECDGHGAQITDSGGTDRGRITCHVCGSTPPSTPEQSEGEKP